MTDRQSTHGHDCWDWGPKHYECAVREVKALRAEVAAWLELSDRMEAVLDQLQAENERLRGALKEPITWIPSADTYRRLGFDPEAPMRALGDARAALAKERE